MNTLINSSINKLVEERDHLAAKEVINPSIYSFIYLSGSDSSFINSTNQSYLNFT
jgi:hypothetical protein